MQTFFLLHHAYVCAEKRYTIEDHNIYRFCHNSKNEQFDSFTEK